MLKKIFLIAIFLFLLPVGGQAQTAQANVSGRADKIFKARVLKILEEKRAEKKSSDFTQQKLELKVLEGEFKGETIIFNGIGEVVAANSKVYKKGDKVLVAAVHDHKGNVNYYITDYVRSGALGWLLVLFVLALLAVGRLKGLKALISLFLTFFLIIKFIIPGILGGSNALIITIAGSALILLAVIYITEGFKQVSHISVFSILISLTLVFFLSWIFMEIAYLTGLSGENILPLVSFGEKNINFQGLLLAGILIGSLGVLDDVVVSQVTTVKEITETDPYQTKGEIFKKGHRVGVSHISSMVNTLFLAYAGVSLPLLLLFVSGSSAFPSWWHIINNGAVATEIVRTLVGSIGIILSVPISTALAVWWYKR